MYEIEYSPQAIKHLNGLKKYQQVRVADTIEVQLSNEPTVETRNRKRLEPNPIAPCELRVDQVRVIYEVTEEPQPTVHVHAIGVKIGNRLQIGGEEVNW
jgi:mRNA-degrading endonuclease RelE of RelBE toxin-antitoxin system